MIVRLLCLSLLGSLPASAQAIASSNAGFESGAPAVGTFSVDSRFGNQGAFFFPGASAGGGEDLPGWGRVEVFPSAGSNLAWVNDTGDVFNNTEGDRFIWVGGGACLILNHTAAIGTSWDPGTYQMSFDVATWGLGGDGFGNTGLPGNVMIIEGRYGQFDGGAGEVVYEPNFEMVQLNTPDSDGLAANNLNWTRVTTTFTIDYPVDYDRFDLVITNGYTEASLGHTLDNFTFVQIPEPSTTWLFLLGSVFALHRKR